MRDFFYSFGKAMRSIIAFMVIAGGFAYMFIFPKEGKTEVITMMMLVLGYYYTANKDSSDRLKAEIKKESDESAAAAG